MSDAHFKGYVAHDKDAIGNLKYESFTPKTWTEDDVEIVGISIMGTFVLQLTRSENPLLRYLRFGSSHLEIRLGSNGIPRRRRSRDCRRGHQVSAHPACSFVSRFSTDTNR